MHSENTKDEEFSRFSLVFPFPKQQYMFVVENINSFRNSFGAKGKPAEARRRKNKQKRIKKMKMFSNKVENTICVEEKWKTISLE